MSTRSSASPQCPVLTCPQRFKAIVDRFGDNPAAMKQAGVIYATEQIIDLIANGVNHIHVYSMNKPEIAARYSGQPVGDPRMISFDRREALRYMGYHGAGAGRSSSGKSGTLCR